MSTSNSTAVMCQCWRVSVLGWKDVSSYSDWSATHFHGEFKINQCTWSFIQLSPCRFRSSATDTSIWNSWPEFIRPRLSANAHGTYIIGGHFLWGLLISVCKLNRTIDEACKEDTHQILQILVAAWVPHPQRRPKSETTVHEDYHAGWGRMTF